MFHFSHVNKRYFFPLFFCILFLYPFTCFAHLLSITATTPFPTQVSTSSTTTATYTVTNTSKIPLTVVNQSEFPANLSVSYSNCGLLGAGQSCLVQLQLRAPALGTIVSSTLKLWAKPSLDGVQHPILVQIVPSQPPAPVPLPVTLIVGGTNLSGFAPLLAISNGFSLNWNLQTTGLPTASMITGVDCTGTGTNVVCIATGNSLGSGFISVSTNLGVNWTTTNYTLFGNAVSATGNGTNAILAVVGGIFPPPVIVPPFLRVSVNGGVSFVNLETGLPNGILFDVSCSGNNASAICVAVGADYTGTPVPFIQTVTINSGSIVNSTTQVITGLLDTGVAFGTSCTGSGSNAVCAAVGQYDTNINPLLMVSSGNGLNWSVKNILAPNAFFINVSCTGSGASALCVAAGEDDTGPAKPLLAVSRNGGASWTLQTGGTFPTLGFFNDINCQGNICVAVGRNDVTSSPLIMVSADGGLSWSVKSISGATPTNGAFSTVTCENGGTSIICVAAGQTPSPTPFLAASIDSGNTWSYQATTPSLPAAGVFDASGGTSFSKKMSIDKIANLKGSQQLQTTR